MHGIYRRLVHQVHVDAGRTDGMRPQWQCRQVEVMQIGKLFAKRSGIGATQACATKHQANPMVGYVAGDRFPQQAQDMLGGSLPEISQKTLAAVQAGFDQWQKDGIPKD